MSATKSSRIARISRRAAATLGVAWGAAPSAAEIVVFDNTAGTFKWTRSWRVAGGEDVIGAYLDITQPPTQSGERKYGTLGRWYYPNMTSSEAGFETIQGEGGVHTARTTDKVLLNWNGIDFFYRPTREYFSNELVSPSDNWWFDSIYFFFLPWYDDFGHGTPAISTLAYLGVRTMINDQFHYGWILLDDYFKPVMWAYETTPNTPIQIPIPTPGSTLAVSLAVLAFIPRRRR